MRSGDILHTLEGIQGISTGKAVQFTIQAIDDVELSEPYKTEWFPFSQVTNMIKSPNEEDCDTLTVKEWILEQKGLMKYLGNKKPVPVAKQDKHGFDVRGGGSDYDYDDDDIPF